MDARFALTFQCDEFGLTFEEHAVDPVQLPLQINVSTTR